SRVSERLVASVTFSSLPSRPANATDRSRLALANTSFAPAAVASATTSRAWVSRTSASSASDIGPSDGELAHEHRGHPLADRDGLTVLSAGPAAGVEPGVVRRHRDPLQRLRAVADDVHVLDRRRDLAVLDEPA